MTSAEVVFVGDIIPTKTIRPCEDVQRVFNLIRGADISIGNFEMPLCDECSPIEKFLNIKAPPSIAPSLRQLGIDVVSVANNHAADYGWRGLLQTIELLHATGISVIGAGENILLAMSPEIRTVRRKRVGVLPLSCLIPPGMAAAADRPGISPIHIRTSYEIDPFFQIEEPGDLAAVRVRTEARVEDVELATDAVRKLRANCDYVVVSIHWGFGSGEALAEYQMPLARRLIEAGADLIHGHHPHAVHAIGGYLGKPILFSLGTFIGQQVFLDAPDTVKAVWAMMSADGYLARLSMSDTNGLGLTLLPTVLNSERLPTLARGQDFERIHERLERLSDPLGASIVRSGQTLTCSTNQS